MEHARCSPRASKLRVMQRPTHHKISLKMGKTSGWEEMAQWI